VCQGLLQVASLSLTKLRVYIGIDPGQKGALCALFPSTGEIKFLGTEDPKVVDSWLKRLVKLHDVRVIMIEKVHSIQGSSAKSNFNFGRSVERVNLLADLSGASVDMVTPKLWQKHVGVTAKGPAIKKDVAALAKRLYPDAKLYGPRGGLLDGKSDALMIAHYAFKTYINDK
jgi:hypothetical protein